jgi:hypothetical protein
MRYINKNQITEFLVEELSDSETKNVGKQWLISIYLIDNDVVELYKDTKEECIALAEKLGLTLIY